jgi:AzlC protein
MISKSDSGRSIIREGLVAAWPICLGFFPIGLSLGVLAQKVGLAPWQMALMSIIVFAGGSQFIAVAMIGSGASITSIVATTFMVNLRHLLMSSAMAVHFQGVSRRFLTLELQMKALPSTWPVLTRGAGTVTAPWCLTMLPMPPGLSVLWPVAMWGSSYLPVHLE